MLVTRSTLPSETGGGCHLRIVPRGDLCSVSEFAKPPKDAESTRDAHLWKWYGVVLVVDVWVEEPELLCVTHRGRGADVTPLANFRGIMPLRLGPIGVKDLTTR